MASDSEASDAEEEPVDIAEPQQPAPQNNVPVQPAHPAAADTTWVAEPSNTDIASEDEEEEQQGPNALSGQAAAAEEASAQERLLATPAPPSPPSGLRARLRRALETFLPTVAAVVLPPATEFPAGFEPKLAVVADDKPGDECSICLAELGPCVTTPCGHSFHAACLEHYFNTCQREPGQRSRCPLCRSSVHAPLPIEVRATSGLPIEAVSSPTPGGRCHFDRPYRFIHLGDFQRPNMLYLLSSNEDRKTSSSQVMWVLDLRLHCTVHLNFRSERHACAPGVENWLAAKQFELNRVLRSTSSSGIPNGPYSGPVYSRVCQPGRIELNGSNTFEGVYFVFVELHSSPLLEPMRE